jgi:hypothetical protein
LFTPFALKSGPGAHPRLLGRVGWWGRAPRPAEAGLKPRLNVNMSELCVQDRAGTARRHGGVTQKRVMLRERVATE